ncbi:hypothetical protein LXL04_014017 [Taraxacum kok-saghyz]
MTDFSKSTYNFKAKPRDIWAARFSSGKDIKAAAPEHSNPRRSLHSNSNSGGPWQLPAPSVFSASPEEIGDRFIPPIYRFCCLFRSAPGLISPIFGDRFIPIRSRFDFLLRFSRARDLRRRSAAPPASLLSASPAPARDLHPLHQRRRSARQFEFLQGFAGQIEFDSLKQVTGSNARFKFNVLNQNRDKWKRQGQMEDRRWTNGSARDKWTNQIIVNQHVTLVVFQTFKMYGGAKNMNKSGRIKSYSGSFENSYIPENPITLKPLTFSKNRL